MGDTGIHFATFGLLPWPAVPQLPAEFMLMAKHFPVNIYIQAFLMGSKHCYSTVDHSTS